jgi:hypothetical protein
MGGGPVTGQPGSFRPLLVAGVAGGVGTSTWARIVRLAAGLPVQDIGLFRGGLVDVLVTSNTAVSASRVGAALRACQRSPILVVMHIAPGVIAESRSYLRKVSPHIAARLDIAHHRSWLEMVQAPGEQLSPRMKDVMAALRQFPGALRAMYGIAAAPDQPGLGGLAGRPAVDRAGAAQPQAMRRAM